MATAMYLEQYLDSLETLPLDLQRNFQLMRDLDERSEDIKVEIDKATADYVAKAKELPPSDRVTEIKRIQDHYSKCREYADDKVLRFPCPMRCSPVWRLCIQDAIPKVRVQLAMQTYEMVDKHIRRLDSDLARFEADLKDKTIQELTGANSVKRDSDSTAAGDKKRRKKGRVMSEDEEKVTKNKPETSLIQPMSSDVLDMPVDPNEPTYCLCHQVSYGEMIGCDNQDCPVEWYHFGCVGLATKPKGKWFCPKCRDKKKR